MVAHLLAWSRPGRRTGEAGRSSCHLSVSPSRDGGTGGLGRLVAYKRKHTLGCFVSPIGVVGTDTGGQRRQRQMQIGRSANANAAMR